MIAKKFELILTTRIACVLLQ